MNAAMEQGITNWTNWLLAEGLSETTISAYGWDVRHLARRFPEKAPLEYVFADLVAYQAERRLAGVGDQARKRSVSACKNFFLWARGKRSPAAKLKRPQPKRRAQRALDWDGAAAVLAVCDPSTACGLRDLALLCLLMESGLRNREVCRLELAKVNLQTRRLWVVCKGGDEKEGVFDEVTAAYLAAWIKARAEFALPETETVFCAIGGGQPGAPLTHHGLRSIFRKIGKAAGLTGGFSPHDLRRTCATLKTRLGAPSRVVQVGGRWSNLREVERYTATLGMDEFATFSPVGRLVEQGDLAGPAPAASVERAWTWRRT